MTSKKHSVVIVGGGFAGVAAARALRRTAVDITLIDKNNYHLFQPLLYQVATGGLSPANIAAPLRHVFRKQSNVRVRLANVTGINVKSRRIVLADDDLEYDTLIVATGSETSYYGNDKWSANAQGLKSIEDATEIRAKILGAFEAAEFESDPVRRKALLTFVIVGAGPTGVELAGALAEIARHTLNHEFRNIDPREASIVLVEQRECVLPPYPERLSQKAAEFLKGLDVKILTGATVLDIDSDTVSLQTSAGREQIQSRTVLWAAGVKASPLASVLARHTDVQQDRSGRLFVEPDLTLPLHPEIFVVGDIACAQMGENEILPAIAPVAAQEGSYVGGVIRHRIAGKPSPPFQYRDFGMMATIGRRLAVAKLGNVHLTGNLAWMCWLFVHLMKLVLFENRILVFIQWATNYLTWNRTARLITKTRRE